MSQLAIFIYTGTHQALHHALSLSVTALSFGEQTTLVLFNEGLAGWSDAFKLKGPGYGDSPWAANIEHGFRQLNVPSVPTMARECREIGRDKLRILACSGSVEVLGLDSALLIENGTVDDVVGLPTIWRRTQSARVITV